MFFHVTITVHMLQEVLKVGLNTLQYFFQEVKVCRLPLNPALLVQGIEADVSLARAMDYFFNFFYFFFFIKRERE